MDLFSLFLFTHENNEIKSPTKIYDFTVYIWRYHAELNVEGQRLLIPAILSAWIYHTLTIHSMTICPTLILFNAKI